MAKYSVQVECLTTATYIIEADSEEEAAHIALNGFAGVPEDVSDGDCEVVSTVRIS